MTFDDLLAGPDPAFVLDPVADRFLAANPPVSAMLGYTPAELLETPVSDIHRGDLPQLREFVGRVLREGRGTTITLTCRTRSGRCLPTEITLQAFEHEDRVCILALIRDRSEHRGGQRPLRSGSGLSGILTGMVTKGLIVRLEAKAGKEEELAALLESALPIVGDEPATIAWFALRTGISSFAIVDVFPDEDGRRAHLDGAVAAALLSRADELLANPLEILPADVVAAKLP